MSHVPDVWLIGRVDQMTLLADHLAEQGRLARWDSFVRLPSTQWPRSYGRNRRVPDRLRSVPGNHFLPDLMGWVPRKLNRPWAGVVTDTLLSALARQPKTARILHGQGNYSLRSARQFQRQGGVFISDVTGQMASTRWRQMAPVLGPDYRLPSLKLARQRLQEAWIADAITVPSEAVKEALAELGIPEEKLHLIPFDVPLANTLLSLPCQSQLHKNEYPRILFVGRLCPTKGWRDVLHLAEALGNTAEIRAAGSGAQTRHVMCLGQLSQDQLVEEYRRADIFVFPSHSEGSARVVQEAMAAGLAVVTTKEAGSPVVSGKTGLLVPAGDAQELIRVTRCLIADEELRKRLGTAARRQMQAQLDEGYGPRVERLYDKLLAKCPTC